MKHFQNIATLVKQSRLASNLTQEDISRELGYKNAQFVSNISRGKCSLPIKHIVKTAELLKIDKLEIKVAMLRDYESKIDAAFEVNHA